MESVDGLIVVSVGGEIRRYFNHEPERFSDAIEIHGRVVGVDERWHLLRVGSGYLFNVLRVEGERALTAEDVDCEHGPTGGFAIRLSDVEG